MPIVASLCGVYGIRCHGKIYVGSSVDIRQRWYVHRGALRQGKHPNQHLQEAWNTHGEQAFSLEILELCSRADYKVREDAWIQATQAYDRQYGFNIVPSSVRGYHHAAETRAKLKEARHARPPYVPKRLLADVPRVEVKRPSRARATNMPMWHYQLIKYLEQHGIEAAAAEFNMTPGNIWRVVDRYK